MTLHHPSKELLLEYSAGSLSKAASIAVAAHLQHCDHCRQQVLALSRLGAACWDSEHAEKAHATASDSPSTINSIDISPVDSSLFEKVMAACEQHDAEKAFHAAKASHSAVSTPSNVVSLNGISLNPLKDQNQRGNQRAFAETDTHGDARTHAHQNVSLPPLVNKLIQQSQPLHWKRLSPSIQVANLTAGQSQCEVSLIRIKAGGKVLEHDHKGNEWTVVLDGAFSDQNGVYQAGDFLQQSPGHIHAPQATANKDCLCLSVTEAPVKFTGWLSRIMNPFLSVQAN